MDYMQFETPYSKGDKAKRLLWSLTWLLLARPFPKSVASGWKRFFLRMFGAKITNTARAAVFKDVEPWTVVGGSPAIFFKIRVFKNTIEVHFKQPHLYTGSLARKEAT